MTIIQKRLLNSYTILVMGGRLTLEQVPETEVTLEDGTASTMRKEVEIEIARRTVKALS